MKYFFDTEFHEDGRTIDLISIGVVADDGRELYREDFSYDLTRALGHEWLRRNVVPHLTRAKDHLKTRAHIRDDLLAFVGDDPKPEFWAYYADYDWVALCQLFGTMMDLPAHFPKWCRDLKQLSWSLGSPEHPKQADGAEHNALHDARWNRDLYDFLMQQEPK